jgi:hypothetical protein
MRFPWQAESKKGAGPLKAYYASKMKFGRAPQSRMANILRTPGDFKRTNEAAIYMDGLIEGSIDFTDQVRQELASASEGYTKKENQDVTKKYLVELKNSLQEGLKQTGGSQRGSGSITITINRYIVNFLIIILNLIIAFFWLFIAIMGEGASNTGSPFIGFISNNSPKKIEEYKGGKTRRQRSRKSTL